MICKYILLITFLNEPELDFFAQLNGFKYCYVSLLMTQQFVGQFPRDNQTVCLSVHCQWLNSLSICLL